MDTGAELLAQAHTLQSLQHKAAEQAFQDQLHIKLQPQPDQQRADEGSEAMPSSQRLGSGSPYGQAQHPFQSRSSNPPLTEGALAEQRAAAAKHDMQSVALDIVESQLPLWSSKPALDWSAQQHLSKYQSQVSSRLVAVSL